jgi:hypothetical protein
MNAARYHAFISYAHEDTPTVEWLRRLLSTFWVPWKWRRRIFLDQESLRAGGGLSATLKDALKQSRFLIVCCSKDSGASHWVNQEIGEFLESHPAENVLACLVGDRAEGPCALPQAVQRLQERLNDELFTPDLRGHPEATRGRARRTATREALALLAPLVGLPGKDELLDQRKKTMIVGAVLAVVLAAGGTGWKLWDDRPASQIQKILVASPAVVNAIANASAPSKSAPPQASAIADAPGEPRRAVTGEWLRTLVLVGRGTDALATARRLERPDARLRALADVAEQLRTATGIRHYVDRWGRAAWEPAPAPSDPRILGDSRHQAEQAATEAVRTATEVVEAARTIGDAASRFEVTIRVADMLDTVGKTSDAAPATREALEAARKIGDAGARVRALGRVMGALARAGRPDEATALVPEALASARNLDAGARWSALGVVADTLARAGKSSEARETARGIDDPSARTQAVASVVDVLAKADHLDEARAVARLIETPDERAKALAGIVDVLVQSGAREGAGQVADEMLAAVAQLTVDVRARYTATAHVIETLAGLGRTDAAVELTRRANNEGDRARALGWIVGVAASTRQREAARRVAAEAVETARHMVDASARAAVLMDVAEALANADSSAEVSPLAREALTAFGPRASPSQLERIVRLFTLTGKKQDAKQVAERELAAIGELPAGRARTNALASLALVTAVARAGTGAEARQVARMVLEAGQQKKFEFEANRPWFLIDVVGTLAANGMSAEAVDASGQVVDPLTRLRTLVRVADELARTGAKDKARDTLERARRLARQLTTVQERSSAFAEVAAGLARLGDVRQAREAVESTSSPGDKLAAYIVIAREYALERRPGLTTLFDADRSR